MAAASITVSAPLRENGIRTACKRIASVLVNRCATCEFQFTDANAVRAAQPQLQLTDALAHRCALLAMHQMGLVIAARHPRFVLAGTLEDIAAALVTGAIPVWLPFALQHDDPALPADWTATSDALAARLAERMGGASVALVKSCAVAERATLADVTAGGIVDPVFGEVVARARLSWVVYGAGDEGRLADRLGAG